MTVKVALGELVTISGGGTPSKKVPEYFTGTIPWVSPKDMKSWDITTSIDRLTEEAVENSSAKLIEPEAVLLVIRSGVLKHSLPVGINRVPVTVNQDLKALRCGDRILPEYLARFLQAKARSILAHVRGTTADNIPTASLRQLKVTVPPLDEQKRIAEVLDRAEALRARRRAALALLDELTQSIFLDMFGDPVTNPEGWPLRPIVELAENKDSMRVPIKQSDRDERSGKYPYYGSVGIIDDIDDFIYEGPHLLISEDGKHLETRNRPIACLADGQFWVNNHAHELAANGNAELVFLAFNLEMRPLHQFVTGIDQFKLNRKSMDKIPVAVPPIELQQEFAQRIRAIEDQKSRFEAHLGELGSLFASLQSRAFKGELFGCSLEPVAAD